MVSVTRVEAGESPNAIPERATVSGTARALDEETRDLIEETLRRQLEGVAAAHGLQTEWQYERRYPVTSNAAEHVERAASAAAQTVGEAHVRRDDPPLMGAEDFGWMLRAQPGCYLLLGAGEERAMLHHPRYDFNDSLIPIGASYWVRLVEESLPL